MNSSEIAAWGGSGGEAWSFEARSGAGIVKITLQHGDAIDAISLVTETTDGRLESSPSFGGTQGSATSEIVLDWPREYLTSINGTYRNFYSVPDAIRSLEFTTNLGRKLGPYGQVHGPPDGTNFSLTINRGAIVGFHGRTSGWVLDSIGIFIRP